MNQERLFKAKTDFMIGDNMGKKYKFMEFFVGAGGSHLGFKKTKKFETVLVNDFQKNMCDTFKYNNPDVKNVICGSIIDLKGKDLLKKSNLKKGELDVVFGGVVCKGFSLAGVRSSSDARNQLYIHYINRIKEMQPRIALIENVPGMASMNVLEENFCLTKKEQLDDAMGKLQKLNGMKSSQRKGLASEDQIKEISSIEKKKDHYKKLIKQGDVNVIDDIIKRYNEAGYNVVGPKILDASKYGGATSRKRLFIVAIRKDLDCTKFKWPKEIGGTITINDILKKIDYSNKNDLDNLPMNHTEKTIRRFKFIPEGKNIVSVMDKLPTDLRISKFYSRGCTMRLNRNKPAPTLVPGHSNFPVHPWEDRSITVREASAIMGFPLDYRFFGSHTSRCEQAGQAVVVEMAEALAKSVASFLKKVNLKE